MSVQTEKVLKGHDVAVRELKHFINGEYVASASGKTFENLNPSTNKVLATVAEGDSEDINRAVAAAKKAYESGPWPKMLLAERSKIIQKMSTLIEARLEEFAKYESLDTGKPISESREGDIPRSAHNLLFYSGYTRSLADECFTSSPTERHFTVREPLGVVGLITPWNFPLHLATWKIAPSLMMGNTCVLKPAEWTPYTATLLGEIAQQAGLPEGVLNIVHGFGPDSAGEALTRHPDVKAISFTGECGTGKAIMRAAADTLKKVSFELGGKGANIIFEDAAMTEAIPMALRAAFRNQGEICLAGSRLFVQERVFGQVVEQLVKLAEEIKVGNPLDPATTMGALIHKEHMEKVEKYIAIARKEGNVLTGGDRLKELPNGNFLTPAIVTGITNDSPLMQEEIFGPVLPVVSFKDEAEVIAWANSTQYGLSSSLWSQDVNRCHRVASAIRTGMVWVNTWFARDLRSAFGGMNASGIGREGGRHSLEFFSEAKTIGYKYL